MAFNFGNPEEKLTQGGSEKSDDQKHLMIEMPGGNGFVPLGKWQIKREYEDEVGPRLVLVLDEVAELLLDSKIKTEAGKEETQLTQEILSIIQSITQLGRSAGIHCIICPLALDTIVPTTEGCKELRDVKIGDRVFDSKGNPINVTGFSEIKESETLYKIILDNFEIKSDGDHRFPVNVNGTYEVHTMEEIYHLYNNDNDVLFIGNQQDYVIRLIEIIPNELVRCLEVDSKDHLFLITNKGNRDWNGGEFCDIECIATHNTQRNDKNIISGVIQANSLALDTKVRVMRKKSH